MNIGFTGTKNGMTEHQFESLRHVLQDFCSVEAVNFHQGLCVGADCEAAMLAFELGCEVFSYPGFPPKNPKSLSFRGSFNQSHITYPAKSFIERNHDIVNSTELLIATPAQDHEIRRSGTWTTIRYAKNCVKPILIIYPSGAMNK